MIGSRFRIHDEDFGKTMKRYSFPPRSWSSSSRPAMPPTRACGIICISGERAFAPLRPPRAPRAQVGLRHDFVDVIHQFDKRGDLRSRGCVSSMEKISAHPGWISCSTITRSASSTASSMCGSR